VNSAAWLVLAYTLPAEPSRLRVSIWRRLRKIGAIYLDEGVWVLPNTDALSGEVRNILRDIENFGGTASAFAARDLDVTQSERLRQRVLAARDEEYAELQGQCERFFLHVEHAISTERYTFAEVEELEEELSKLERWLQEISSRDVFESAKAGACRDRVVKARETLTRFTETTFALLGEDNRELELED
jgi:hypothetical protein